MNICPYDRKHIISRKSFFRHLKVCPSRPKNNFYEYEGINKVICNLQNQATDIQIDQLEDKQLIEFCQKIDDLYKQTQKYNFFQNQQDIFNDIIINKSQFGKKQLDEQQCQLLCDQIIKNIYLKQFWNQDFKFNIIEPGSGTGKLSLYLSQIFKSSDTFSNTFEQNQIIRNNLQYQYQPSNNFQYLLIERDSGYKGNFDNRIRRNGSKVFRFQADIRNINIQKLLNASQQQTISQQNYNQFQANENDIKNSIIIAKHCCNGATDSVLNWVQNMTYKPKLILIATCCHSKGDGSGYINQNFCEQLNISKQMNEAIHRACAWQFSFSYQQNITELQQLKFITGQKARRILETGRCLWLQQQGYNVKMVQYCDRQISQECFCIVANLK